MRTEYKDLTFRVDLGSFLYWKIQEVQTTVPQLASDCGLTASTIYRILQGKFSPNLEVLRLICIALGLDSIPLFPMDALTACPSDCPISDKCPYTSESKVLDCPSIYVRFLPW